MCRKGGEKMKYYLNQTTKTLHKINGCCHSRVSPKNEGCYKTEDEVISAETKYFKRCKICFREDK